MFPGTTRKYWVYVSAIGGDCSFTVAWLRPDRFRKVLIFESSRPQVRGADYEQLIMETPPKPIRVFMQASTRDIAVIRPG